MTEEEIVKALDSYFDRESPPKFINVSRIPLICQDILAIKNSLVELKDAIKEKAGDHEARIRKLEQKIWQWSGAAGILGALAMWVLDKFV